MQIEILAEGVVSDMVSFMWRHRCWGMATQVAGLKADFMTIFVEVTSPGLDVLAMTRCMSRSTLTDL